jgi:flagellar hook-basal body complex protein FliE
MSVPITPIAAAPVLANPVSVTQAASGGGGAFQEALTSAIQTVESSGQQASASVEQFLSGQGEDLHTTILATERASLTFDLFLQARNKVVSAYQEIMRMQM